MTSKLIALALFTATAAIVFLFQPDQTAGGTNPVTPPPIADVASEQSRIEVVFALDTTGSMGGLIQAAREKIWSIATTMASAQSAPEIRMGLVAYRDRGDDYVSRVIDLSSDLDTMYATLMDLQANGGGDGPESVNQALHDAVHRISWSQDENTYKVVFLIGDAPPHMDYPDDIKYPVTLDAARERDIIVNAIQCGRNAGTTPQWQRIAQLGNGRYFQVEQAGSAVAIPTPYDDELASISAELDDTRLYYGNREAKQKQQRKVAATRKLHAESSVTSLARRAAFNASASGSANLLGEGELVDDIASGRVALDSIAPDVLPEPMQSMPLEEQKALVTEKAERRKELQDRIQALSVKRSEYLRKKVEETGGARDSLDDKIYRAVREQSASVGLHYESDTPDY